MRNDERALVDRARDGDRDAFRAIFDAHRDAVYRLALSLTRDPDTAEDVVQDVFLKAYRSLPRFRGDAKLGSWLYRITVNADRDRRRRARLRGFQVALGLRARPEEPWVEDRPDADPERRTAGRGLRRDVARAIDRLTPAERSVFILRQLEGRSIRDAAQILGRAEGTVKNLFFRALRRLRTDLAHHREGDPA